MSRGQLTGDVPFKVAGQTFTMRFGGAALLALEEAFDGRSWTEILAGFVEAAQAKRMLPMRDVARIVHAALSRHHAHLTLADAADLAMLPEAQAALGAAIQAAFPTEKGAGGTADADPPKRRATPGTGTAR